MLNVNYHYHSLCPDEESCMHLCACVRRIVNLARDYSMKRVCFGKTIRDHKLHVKNLANMEVHAVLDCVAMRFVALVEYAASL